LYAKRHGFRLKRADKRLRKIELLTSPGRILDIGCSLGYFVEAAANRGWDAYGLEISPYAAEVAAKAGLKVKSGILEEAGYDDAFFDCVTMWDVLEHVPDPTQHINEVKRILKPGGIVVTGTPNLAHPVAASKMKNDPPDWRHFKPAEHLYYFTPNSLRMLLRKCDFRVVEPPLFPPKASLATAAVSELISRILPVNDVMVIYGMLDG
jgi:2-polyprenyl-3-methyl-5-hydroxy-6-metoxy-1,4-benzoquinol methylase